MRTDIYVNTITGDIVLKNQNSLEEYLFEWIEETDLQLTAQIILPSNFDIKQLYTIGVQIKIPYTPIYKPIKIRFSRDFGGGNIRIVINQLITLNGLKCIQGYLAYKIRFCMLHN